MLFFLINESADVPALPLLSDRDGGAILPCDQWFPCAVSSAFGTEGRSMGLVTGRGAVHVYVPSLSHPISLNLP